MAAGWFSMSVHALALLAQHKDGYSSSYIAGSVNTHAVFLRRVLKRLVEVGLIETREGRDGGYRLTKPAEEITLAEIYKSMNMDRALAPSPAEPNPACPVGSGMPAVFSSIADEAEDAILQVLSRYTIADVAEKALAGKSFSS
jgi:Rrf2 family transcriptional repressor of oqxAB